MRIEVTKTDIGYRLIIDYDGTPTKHEQELIRGIQSWMYDPPDEVSKYGPHEPPKTTRLL